jgi:predicted XRE-type DNA-binding protein
MSIAYAIPLQQFLGNVSQMRYRHLVKKDQVLPTSELSRAVSAHVKAWMRDRSITQPEVAERLGRAQSYVSERLNGIRALDTDDLDVIAELGGTNGRDLLVFVLKEIRRTPDQIPAPRSKDTP